jgi:acetyltransferase-like isoleucine patch superfamily enzyme
VLGRHSYVAGPISVLSYNSGKKAIAGNFCAIGGGLVILLGGRHPKEWVTTYPFGTMNTHIFDKFDGQHYSSEGRDVIIGNDVWIGGGVTLMPGITVGDGAVIAANSHVVKSVEPYTVVGGNPARYIMHRFDKETIDWLLQIKWWDFPDEVINELVPFLCSDDVDRLRAEIEKRKDRILYERS